MKNWLLPALFIYCSIGLHAQKFEVFTSSVDVRGIAEDRDQIVIYGNGLTWINSSGEVQGKLSLIKDMTITFIVDVVSDGAGGLWVLTRDAFGYVNSNKEGVKIFDVKSLDALDGKFLKRMDDGSLFVVTQNKIIRVAPDHTYKVHFTSPNQDVNYFQMIEVDQDGTMYIGSFRQVFKIDASGQVNKIELPGNTQVQRIQKTKDGKTIVLAYTSIYELEGNQLKTLLEYSQLSSGAKFYDGIFNTADDFWLYANEGNAFHYLNGKWLNYVPPAGMKTGYYGECIIQTKAGHIWMSLNSYPALLKFDGAKWHKIEVQQTKLNNAFTFSYLIPGDELVATTSATYFPLLYNGTSFVPIPGLPETKTNHITKSETGQWYWGSEHAIFTRVNSKDVKLAEVYDPGVFEVLGEEVMFIDSGKICLLKDGKKKYVAQNEHYLGWEELSVYGTKMVHAADNQIFVTCGRRNGLISMYANGQWSKIIEIEGKLIGAIEYMMTYKDQTYVVTSSGSVAVYENKKFHWLYYKPESKIKVRRAYVTPDLQVWYSDDDNILYRINQQGFVQSVQMPVDKMSNILNAVLLQGDNVYDLYFEKTILRVDFNAE